MAQIVQGPLYTEVMGPRGAPAMVFLHPNPFDSACWLFQTAHFSTWYRTIAVDLPGYGRSPSVERGVTMPDVAAACWEAIDRDSDRPAVLVGCSVGSNLAQHMYHIDPERVQALVLCGAGYRERKSFAKRITGYRTAGLSYRRTYGFDVLSPTFRDTPLAYWLLQLFDERQATADVETIIVMLEALQQPDPDWLQRDLDAPVLIITGSEDNTHEAAAPLHDRLPRCEMVVMKGAGHACHLERPWEFDRKMIDFLTRQGVHPPT